MSRHPRLLAAFIVFSIFVFALRPDRSAVLAQTPALRLIAAANVTLRQRPAPESPIVTRLPLGVEVQEAGDAALDRRWVHVLAPDGRDGWVLAALTRPLDPFWRWQTQEQVIVERLGRNGDGFPARMELVSFIERIADSFADTDGRARMDLYRLQAMQQALAAIPAGASRREPYASWLARYRNWTTFNEPGGSWLVAHDAIWKVHDAHEKTTVADEIAWFSVGVGLAGECEGRVPCYLEGRNRLDGEYLRRHPSGAHAAEAVANIGRTAALVSAAPGPGSAYSFDPTKDCAPLVKSTGALRSAVEKAGDTPNRAAALEALGAVSGRCGV